MAFEEVIGQKRIKEILLAAIQRDRLPHALLFYGPEGVGKNAMALELAKLLNCLDPPCHTCPSCLKISRGYHPDVKMIFPVPSSLKPEEIGTLLQERAQQPYANPLFTKSASISIEIVRELQRASVYRPFEGRRKVIMIIEADKMTPDAANAFLKTLEEPPPLTLFVLTTAKPHALLPTIVSRCQKLRFDPLSDEEIEKTLTERWKADPLAARLASRLAVGNYRKAKEFIDEDIDRLREDALELLTTGSEGTVSEVVRTAEQLSAHARGDGLRDFLKVALLWMRDLLLLNEGKGEKEIANIDRIAELKTAVEKHSSAEIVRGIEAVRETLDLLDRNVNQQLAFIELMLKLKDRKQYRS